MRELELRLALVCFGGSSLAVYMNGVSHEILKLVRASKVFHSQTADEKADDSRSYENCAGKLDYGTDTEALYFELLHTIGKKIDLRVVVDVVSRASAGGINGIFLARALAFDLDFDPLRDMWMRLGDIEELMEEETLAQRWSKAYLYPVIWLIGDRIWQDEKPDAEAKRKLSRFIRSRWFEPPFSGKRMLQWMIDANLNMGEAKPGRSLLPRGHKLDLFVSLTNFFGQHQSVTMHDPDRIDEQQHKVSLRFSHQQGQHSARQTDFDDTNVPALGFAARATSSFPGAFPPMRLSDLQTYLKEIGLDWAHEKEFMDKNFAHLDETHDAIQAMSFIDGGVTNNKPFESAIDAITEKPAHRQVDRRVIFVDPRPDEGSEDQEESPETPGFFRTILSSLAAIPRDEPILEDLKEIEVRNREARRFETVMERIELDVNDLIDRILLLEPNAKVSTAMLASWRERAHEQAHAEAGFTYGSYVESKSSLLIDRMGKFLNEWENSRGIKSCSFSDEDIRAWAEDRKYLASSDPGCRSAIPFFRTFDVDYRVRRLRFLIRRMNRFLQDHPDVSEQLSLAAIKTHIYDSIARYRRRWQPDFFEQLPHGMPLDETLNAVGNMMKLEDLDFEEDQLLAEAINQIDNGELRLILFRAYVGFAFYDILMLPMTAHADLQEIDEVRVDRISPLDCEYLHSNGHAPLMGDKLFNFGAFFSRKARENDYIWGRIHAANRLVDFLCDAAGKEALCESLDLDDFRKRLALSIVEAEAGHTLYSAELIERLKTEFAT